MKKSTSTALRSLSETLVSIGIETAQEKRDGEFTVKDAAKISGLSIPRMSEILRDKVAGGVLLARTTAIAGRSTKLYRVV